MVPELRRLAAGNQLRERLWLLLMSSLVGAGRRAEALEAYAQARAAIADQLGVDPGGELQMLYQEILAADVRNARAFGAGAGGAEAGSAAESLPAQDKAPSSVPAVADSLPGSISGGSLQASGAPAEGPAAAEAESIGQPVPSPAQLPADIGDFTGRAEQVRRLCDMLAPRGASESPGAVPIALVAGAGGLGKTTLAVHAAHVIRWEFPDGQLYVDLLGATARPLSPADVLARFLRDLGVEGSRVPAGSDERAALYRTRLTGRRVLVLLDNAKDAAQVRPLLPGSATAAVLVTTRSRMPDLASTKLVDLDVLDDSEALALFSRIVGDRRPEAEPDATAEVLLACAGLPLAIRICAARLAARTRWKIATMADRLRDEQRRLHEMKAGDLAVRASFEVSYKSLRSPAGPGDVDPARAFRLLGLWQGSSISLQAAAALFAEPEDNVADALEGLVDAHLLESPAPDRYRFHDLLRVYASERAQAEESEEARSAAVRRLLTWYLTTADAASQVVSPHRYRIQLESAEEAPPAPLPIGCVDDALAWYDSERGNVVAATLQAASSGLHDVAWRLPTALFSVLARRDNMADCVAVHRIALDSSRKAENRQGEAWVLQNLGEALARMRDNEGIGHLEQALAIRRAAGDRIGEGQAALNIADAYHVLHGAGAALEHALRALDVLRLEGNSYRHGVILNNIGEVYQELGRLDEAVDSFEQARAIFTGINSANGVAYSLHNLGRAYLDLDRQSEALDCLCEALAHHRSIGESYGEALTLKFLGSAQRRTGKFGAARESLTEALAIFTDLREDVQAGEVRAALASLKAQTDR